jgi:D-xylose transport system substrate-binding protein
MTVYKAIKPEAEQAAELAVALARGEEPPAADDQVDNGMKQVPSILLEPIAVTKDNINDTIVKDEFWSVDEICTGKYAAACKEAGIQ